MIAPLLVLAMFWLTPRREVGTGEAVEDERGAERVEVEGDPRGNEFRGGLTEPSSCVWLSPASLDQVRDSVFFRRTFPCEFIDHFVERGLARGDDRDARCGETRE